MKRSLFTLLMIVFVPSALLMAQAYTFGYDAAGNRTSRTLDCEGVPGVELGAPAAEFCEGASIILDAGNDFESYIWDEEEGGSQLIITSPGTYVLEVTDTYGCVSTDQVTVTMTPSPIINLDAPPPICEGSSYIIDAGSGYETYTWDGTPGTSQLEVTTAGTYLLVATDANNCISTGSVTITTLPTPEIRIANLYDPDAILPNPLIADITETINLVVLGGNSDGTYLWSDNNTSDRRVIPMQVIQDLYDGYVEGWVQFTAINGCTGEDAVILQVATPPQSVAESSNEEENNILNEEILEQTVYNLFPNPTNDKFFVSVSDPQKVKRIILFDLKGNVLQNFENIKSYPFEVDLSKHPNGVYLLKVIEEFSFREFKVIRN